MPPSNQKDQLYQRVHFLFMNAGHLLDHLCMLVFATVAALALHKQWGIPYADLIPYATPGFVAFGAFALPAGWLADRWNREAMMLLFFMGIGLASIFCSTVTSPLQMSIGLFAVGVFAAIYHPVGIALVLDAPGNRGMRVATNGVWGNMGVAISALLTAFLIDQSGWRAAFLVPGVISILLGCGYWHLIFRNRHQQRAEVANGQNKSDDNIDTAVFRRVLIIVLLTTALGGLVFQSTTFALPKVLAERTTSLTSSATSIGWLAFLVFAIGSAGQLVVGYSLDKVSPRSIFILVATLQVIFFAGMIAADGWLAIAMAAGFMLAAFGQIPINDVLVGRVARTEWRSRILAVRYTVTITVMALSVPLIAWIHATKGFGFLFGMLSLTALLITVCVTALPAAKLLPQ